jgi:hypothetical protein
MAENSCPEKNILLLTECECDSPIVTLFIITILVIL